MKKKSFKILSLITCLCVSSAVFLFTSCEKENATEPIDSKPVSSEVISLKSGALSFETADLFFETSEKLESMTREERDNWELSLGFTSMRKELNTIFDQISKCENKDEVDEIISKNSDLIKSEDDIVVPIFKFNAYSAICNREGIYYVEGTIHKVFEDKVVSSDDGKIETLNKALSNLKSATEGVRVFNIIDNTNLKGTQFTTQSSLVSTKDKRCYFYMRTYLYYCSIGDGNYYNQVRFELELYNWKRIIFNQWTPYKTFCEFKEVVYTVPAAYSISFNDISFYFINKIEYSLPPRHSGQDTEKFIVSIPVGDPVFNVVGAGELNPYLIKVYGKGKNRGVGDRWAEISYTN